MTLYLEFDIIVEYLESPYQITSFRITPMPIEASLDDKPHKPLATMTTPKVTLESPG